MIAEKYEEMKTTAADQLSGAAEYMHRGADRMTHVVDERPGASLLVSCLAGFAVGLVLSRAFGEGNGSSSFDSASAERFGRNLLNKIEHVLPAMLRDRLSM